MLMLILSNPGVGHGCGLRNGSQETSLPWVAKHDCPMRSGGNPPSVVGDLQRQEHKGHSINNRGGRSTVTSLPKGGSTRQQGHEGQKANNSRGDTLQGCAATRARPLGYGDGEALGHKCYGRELHSH